MLNLWDLIGSWIVRDNIDDESYWDNWGRLYDEFKRDDRLKRQKSRHLIFIEYPLYSSKIFTINGLNYLDVLIKNRFEFGKINLNGNA